MYDPFINKGIFSRIESANVIGDQTGTSGHLEIRKAFHKSFSVINCLKAIEEILKGCSDPSHFIFKINVGKSRIRQTTTLKLNDKFID